MKFCSIVLQLLSVGWCQAFLPCNYFDSIDISRGVLQPNNSIFFGGIEYQMQNYGEINYISNDEMQSVIVQPYFRGCPCQIRPCIRLCCPIGAFVDQITKDEHQQQNIKCRNHSAARNLMAEILHESHESKTINLDQHFTYVNRICKSYFYAEEFNITEVKADKTTDILATKNGKKFLLKILFVVFYSERTRFVRKWTGPSSGVLFESGKCQRQHQSGSNDVLW